MSANDGILLPNSYNICSLARHTLFMNNTLSHVPYKAEYNYMRGTWQEQFKSADAHRFDKVHALRRSNVSWEKGQICGKMKNNFRGTDNIKALKCVSK